MRTRETTIMTVGLGLLFVTTILPMPILFFEKVVLGFLLNLCSIRATLKALTVTSIVRGVLFAMQFGGILGFLIFIPTDIVVTITMLPLSYYIFKKLKIRERVGI